MTIAGGIILLNLAISADFGIGRHVDFIDACFSKEVFEYEIEKYS